MAQPSRLDPEQEAAPSTPAGGGGIALIAVALAALAAILWLLSIAGSDLFGGPREEHLALIESRKLVEHVVMENGQPRITQGHYITLRRQDGRGDKIRRKVDANHFARLKEGQLVRVSQGIANPEKFDLEPVSAWRWQTWLLAGAGLGASLGFVAFGLGWRRKAQSSTTLSPRP